MNNNHETVGKDWKKTLSPETYHIMREKGTERPFSGKYYDYNESGIYKCAACGQVLFNSKNKFSSGCGWPSYWKPIDKNVTIETPDNSIGMRRTEITCSKCGGHLGHVFNDGPPPTGLRYCINSAALVFQKTETATFGSGCFWCSEAAFESIDGVEIVKAGYMGGSKEDASYRKVCSGNTGHAEVSQIIYDPTKVSYKDLLNIFWKIHDPTSLNKQGADTGSQYRSVIFYHTDKQREEAIAAIKELQKSLNTPIVTEVTKAKDFFEAEDHHQDYYKNNSDAPYCRAVIAPKLKKLKK